jgi:hypothetical protein
LPGNDKKTDILVVRDLNHLKPFVVIIETKKLDMKNGKENINKCKKK